MYFAIRFTIWNSDGIFFEMLCERDLFTWRSLYVLLMKLILLTLDNNCATCVLKRTGMSNQRQRTKYQIRLRLREWLWVSLGLGKGSFQYTNQTPIQTIHKPQPKIHFSFFFSFFIIYIWQDFPNRYHKNSLFAFYERGKRKRSNQYNHSSSVFSSYVL